MAAIGAALDAAGMDRGALRPADLAPANEFHIRGTMKHAVEIAQGFSGASVSWGELRASAASGNELVQVLCAQASPANECTSVNRVFFVRDGRWQWDEREGTACRPKTNGWCAARRPLPDASEFPR